MIDNLKQFQNSLEYDYCNAFLIAFCARKNDLIKKFSPKSQFSCCFEHFRAIEMFFCLFILKLLLIIFNLSPSWHLQLKLYKNESKLSYTTPLKNIEVLPFNALPLMVLRFCGVDKPKVHDHQNFDRKNVRHSITRKQS